MNFFVVFVVPWCAFDEATGGGVGGSTADMVPAASEGGHTGVRKTDDE